MCECQKSRRNFGTFFSRETVFAIPGANLSASETPNAPDEKSAEERFPHPSAALNHSAGQLPDLVLNQPSRRRGQLIHPADAGQIPAVNGIGRRNGGVFPHEHCCHSDTLLP